MAPRLRRTVDTLFLFPLQTLFTDLRNPPKPSRYANGEYYCDPRPFLDVGTLPTDALLFGPGLGLRLASGISDSEGIWSLVTEHDRYTQLC